MKNLSLNISISIIFFLVSNVSFGVINQSEINLNGRWKFNVGDNPSWAKPDFDDSQWDEIYAPGDWEDQGYRKNDGLAWYRKEVTINNKYSERTIHIELGYIDDVDEVFINGIKIGQTGEFPPDFSTGYNSKRKYLIPNSIIKFGEENTIAVRVFDSRLNGGIVGGHLKIIFTGSNLSLDINLAGEWYFNKSKKIKFDERSPIIVPGLWENQGYYNYDGYGVYSQSFTLPDNLSKNDLVLMLGRIDDADRVYINGKLVGSMGRYEERIGEAYHHELRNYFLPNNLLKEGEENSIEVRVWDEVWDGGIVEGPIGIVTQTKFIKYWMSKRRN